MRTKKTSLFTGLTNNLILIIRILLVVSVVAFALTISAIAKPVAANMQTIGVTVTDSKLQESARYLMICSVALILIILSMAVVIPLIKYGFIIVGLFLLVYYGKLFLISLQKKN